jgi:hypothetical protein
MMKRIQPADCRQDGFIPLSREAALAARRSFFPLADQAREKSVKIGEDSWIKVLILMHLFCFEP